MAGSGGNVGYGGRREYKDFVLAVHGLCTRSTWFLYSQYAGFVLTADSRDGGADCCCRRSQGGWFICNVGFAFSSCREAEERRLTLFIPLLYLNNVIASLT